MPSLALIVALAPSLACEGSTRNPRAQRKPSPNLPPTEHDAKDSPRSPEVEPALAPSVGKPTPPTPVIPGSAPDGSSKRQPNEDASAPSPPADVPAPAPTIRPEPK
jgi:hypothetical protein